MADIKSLSDCFNVEDAFDGYLSSALNTINEYLEQHQNDIIRNEDMYGKMAFHCGEYTPLSNKMKDIYNDKIPSARNEIVKCKNDILKAFWAKRKRDLEAYSVYCDEQIKRFKAGYNMYMIKKNSHDITSIVTHDEKKGYDSYLKYVDEKKQVTIEIAKTINKMSNLSKIEY